MWPLKINNQRTEKNHRSCLLRSHSQDCQQVLFLVISWIVPKEGVFMSAPFLSFMNDACSAYTYTCILMYMNVLTTPIATSREFLRSVQNPDHCMLLKYFIWATNLAELWSCPCTCLWVIHYTSPVQYLDLYHIVSVCTFCNLWRQG